MILRFLLVMIGFINMEAATRIGIVSDACYAGERELAWRIKLAGESLGWEVFLDEARGRVLNRMQDLDFIICVLPHIYFVNKSCFSYLAIFHPFNFLDVNKRLLSLYSHYHGYLLTIPLSESFAAGFEENSLFSIPFYPTIQPVPYKKLALNHLVTITPFWGNRLNDPKFKTFYRLLSQSGFTRFYGANNYSDCIQQGYLGSFPFDGCSIINILQQHGITLILHSDIHNFEKIPSPRIFEAAAASTVIISDENQFVKEHFGDSVFYIDTSVSAEEIYKQIECHMETIYQNPEMALNMAARAHQKFEDHFLMTDQLLKLKEMDEKRKLWGRF